MICFCFFQRSTLVFMSIFRIFSKVLEYFNLQVHRLSIFQNTCRFIDFFWIDPKLCLQSKNLLECQVVYTFRKSYGIEWSKHKPQLLLTTREIMFTPWQCWSDQRKK